MTACCGARAKMVLLREEAAAKAAYKKVEARCGRALNAAWRRGSTQARRGSSPTAKSRRCQPAPYDDVQMQRMTYQWSRASSGRSPRRTALHAFCAMTSRETRCLGAARRRRRTRAACQSNGKVEGIAVSASFAPRTTSARSAAGYERVARRPTRARRVKQPAPRGATSSQVAELRRPGRWRVRRGLGTRATALGQG